MAREGCSESEMNALALPKIAPSAGLYNQRHEHDACGVGFVADVHGRQKHEILRQALAGLANLAHRGAVSADELTGDGAGVLTQIPLEFFARELRNLGIKFDDPRNLAVGMLFTPTEVAARERCFELIAEVVSTTELELLGWRRVPVDLDALGEIARQSRPDVHQVLLRRPPGRLADDDAFERALYVARRRIEKRIDAVGISPFHILSLSHRTIVYKGLMVAHQLDRYFRDLADPDFATAIAVFHQRYSTNTHPMWHLAHPFRMIAHNGEINTLAGNVLRMKASEPSLTSEALFRDLEAVLPIVQKSGSDSSSFDNVFELLVMAGRDPLHAMMMMVPEAYRDRLETDPELSAFFEYHHTLMQPWDGPAAMVFSDGRICAAALDRNGLRPLRYWVIDDGTVVAGSEAGIVRFPEDRIVEKGRLGPGKIIAVDTSAKRLLHDGEIKRHCAVARPYSQWTERRLLWSKKSPSSSEGESAIWDPAEDVDLVRCQKVFGYGAEDVERILTPMALDGKEPMGSMGDDTPIAAFSHQPQWIYRYFKQRFAQVTNPPIDPIREQVVMSLNTAVGSRVSFLDVGEEGAGLAKFASPIIDQQDLDWLRNLEGRGFRSAVVRTRFMISDGPQGMIDALKWLTDAVESAVDRGCSLIVLSDRDIGKTWAPIPMLLAVSTVHHSLIRSGKRMKAALICDTGDAREDHHFACLIGYSAALIHPYLAFASVRQIAKSSGKIDPEAAVENYRKTIDYGLRKIMSKMGISTISSYRGAQVFEAIGISNAVVERHFSGTESRIGGVGLKDIAIDVLRFHAGAYGEHPKLREMGVYRFKGHDGEYHSFNPLVFKALHRAIRNPDREAGKRDFDEYSRLADERPVCNLRDLLEWKETPQPLPIDEIESAERIAMRFCTQAMSHGALSRESHEVLAVAMNRIGGKSNSGEGGEAPERLRPYSETNLPSPDRWFAPWRPSAGDSGNSAIKQVASGRFGVTPEYLISAREIEIKMAQGSKPGEGGQIPADKVSGEIADIRRAQPGTALISPPPHHDIYSIEDLSQLIYDLKRINPAAKVCVKLVSVAGVGTIAAGVAKGYADCVQISGHDGGTGASPLSSIKHAGMPWELGLAEAQQVLVRNRLRGRVTLRADGGMKTGRDVVIAALLGAEEFGFGTAAVVAAGCVMTRKCHLNTCPVGIATQRPELRAKFPGTPEQVVAFMLFIAEQVRQIMARIGVRRFEDLIGRVDLLQQRSDLPLPKTSSFDLSAMLHDATMEYPGPRRCTVDRNHRPEKETPLDETVAADCLTAIETGERTVRRYPIRNCDRSVGARLSGLIAAKRGDAGLPPETIELQFHGVAGQSFGAFCNRGTTLILEGEAQDYVAKSMFGGRLVLKPPAESRLATERNVIAGNTVLYGATGGSLFAAGRVGERFAVRNSGAHAVVEGCGDHGCEYMTGGVVVVLGATGRNFAAGMTGGLAFVFDPDNQFRRLLNPGSVGIERISADADEELLRLLIEQHAQATASGFAKSILQNWQASLPSFWKASPVRSAFDSASSSKEGKSPLNQQSELLLQKVKEEAAFAALQTTGPVDDDLLFAGG